MSKYASKRYWIDTTDRAVATFAQAAVGALTATTTGLLDLDWVQVVSVAGLAALVSVLTSVAFRGRGEESAPYGAINELDVIEFDADEFDAERAAELGLGKHGRIE